MPWPLKQQRAIFLRVKREKGEKAAVELMRQHGYGGKSGSAKHLMTASASMSRRVVPPRPEVSVGRPKIRAFDNSRRGPTGSTPSYRPVMPQSPRYFGWDKRRRTSRS